MSDLIERSAVLRVIFDSVGRPATEIYQKVRELPAAEEPYWIPITERMPENGSLLGKLICDSEGKIRIAERCAELTLSDGRIVYTDLIDLVRFLVTETDTPTTEWKDCTHITHWMPLPQVPEEA